MTKKPKLTTTNNLARVRPDLANQLVDKSLAAKIIPQSTKKVEWQCEHGHRWKTQVRLRTKFNTGCPYCANTKILPGFNDLATTHPELAKQLVNQDLATKVMAGSVKKVEWRCEKGHTWKTRVLNRAKDGHNCPYCSGNLAIPGETDLATLRPDLAVQLVNKDLATQLTVQSSKKVEWYCDKGHIYITAVYHRNKGHNCPYCSGRRALTGFNDLATTHPELAAQLVNQNLATKVTKGSAKIVEWRCDHGHTWKAKIAHRTKGSGCPYCARKKAWPGETDLATTHPDIATQLVDQSLATKVSANSGKVAQWQCEHGHVWEAKISTRTQGYGCPYCSGRKRIIGVNDLATTHPDLATQLVDQSLATKISAGSGNKVEWRCEKGHTWKTAPINRLRGENCPYCSNHRILPGFNDLATTHPDIAAQLVNQDLATKLVAGSQKKVKWRCNNGHEWTAMVFTRVRGDNCPYCSGKRVLPGFNDLATTDPDIAQQLANPELATTITRNSGKSLTWQCEHGHTWSTRVCHRIEGQGCPYCSNNKLLPGFNDLATRYPDIATQLVDQSLAPKLLFGSTKKVEWVCEHGHKWKTYVYSRTRQGTNCPICNQSHGEIFVHNYLQKTHFKIKQQWAHKDCRYKQALLFDFALFDNQHTDMPLACIEYQGQQHYDALPHFNKHNDNIKLRQKRDNIKRTFCKENNIPLIEIPFSFDTQELVDEILHACLATIV